MDDNQNKGQDNNTSNNSQPAVTLNSPVPAQSGSNNSQATPVNQTTSGSEQDSKDSSNKRVVATIFGILILIMGVAAGVYLVQREHDIRNRAAIGRQCDQSPDCVLFDEPGNSGSESVDKPITHLFITAKEFHKFAPPGTNNGCYDVSIDGNSFSWRKVGDGPDCKDVSNIQVWTAGKKLTPTPIPTKPPGVTATPTPTGVLTPTLTPTLPPKVSAKCEGVEVYDSNWTMLSQEDLESLKPGNNVRLLVGGSATSGAFDKARFVVNGNTLPETTNKRPGTDDFYIEYQIPSNVTDFNVSAEIHHSSLGWL